MTKKLIDPLLVSYSWGLFDQKEKHSILTNIRSIFTPEECERINSYGLIKYADELRDAHVVPTPTFSKFSKDDASSTVNEDSLPVSNARLNLVGLISDCALVILTLF